MTYGFYGRETANVPPVSDDYPGIRDPRDLYEALMKLWCAETCAPRMRDDWSPENPTLGQCSITSFLAQDIFGGEVYGIDLPEGGIHCFNQIGDCMFDLTNEQFGDRVLDYGKCSLQSRDKHFSAEEKRLRYEMLKEKLSLYLKEKQLSGQSEKD